MATMKQIASIAGVSLGTVDRVLNNRGSVNADTARHIMEIARSLDYIPNKTARCLAVRKQNLKIGCVMISPRSNEFYAQVEAGIQKKAAELADYNISVITKYIDPDEPAGQNRLLDEMREENVKGIVLCGYNLPETREKVAALSYEDIPVITACADLPDSGRVCHVGSDNAKMGRVAGQLTKLIGGERVRVGIVVYGHSNMRSYRSCVDSFEDYVRKNRDTMSISGIEGNYDDDFKSYSVVETMLREDPGINLIFVVSAGIYGACKAVERMEESRRPRVVCLNCTPSAREMMKKGVISAAINQQPEYQGSKALDLMFNLLCFNIKPGREHYHSDMDILIGECLE